MNTYRITLGIVTHFLFLISLHLNAAVPQWRIVPSQSLLTFTATQNGAPVVGQFKTFTGDIKVDPNDLNNSSIAIIVDINSMSTSYSEVKKTLLTTEWFNVNLFPKAEFQSNHIEKTGDKAYQAKGTLTIRGKSLPITLLFTSEQPDANTGIVVGHTVIKRTAFDVGQGDWSSTKEIRDEVTIKFKVVGIKIDEQ